jgi:hypothetical protein
MSNKEQLIEQHIREYESRLKHIDELYERAHEAAGQFHEGHDAHSELQEIKTQREKLPQHADEIKSMPVERWREETVQNAGPMAIWDILAQKLEDFVERHE